MCVGRYSLGVILHFAPAVEAPPYSWFMGDETRRAPRAQGDEAVRTHEKQISDQRLHEATGRTRDEWFEILDDAGARSWDHTRIARWLGGKHDVDGWWAQSVTIGYEQSRGLREAGQQRDGSFEASVSKTIRYPVDVVWPHLAEEDLRRDWCDVELGLRGTTPGGSVRLECADGSRVTLLPMALPPTANGEERCRVQVQHTGLANAEDLAETKAFWKSALAELVKNL